MKTKLFKRIGLLGLSTLAAFTLMSNVKAEEQCTTYKNYYYFSEINSTSGVEYNLNNGDPWERGHATYFPALSSTAKPAKGSNSIIKYDVCLQKGDQLSKESETYCNDTWDLNKYYQKEQFIAEDPTIKDFTINNVPSSYSYRSENSTDGDGDPVVTTYYRHGKWFTVDGNDEDDAEGGSTVNYINTGLETLIGGSFVPITNVNMQDPQNNMMRAVVRRTVTNTRYQGATPFNIVWAAGGPEISSVLTPALYYVEYQDDCHGKYKAIINYYYWDMTNDKEPENPEKVIFKDETKPNPYTENDLDDGYTSENPVVSPEAANPSCKPMEDDVTIEIDGKDFVHNVYYKCTSYNANIHYCIEKEDGTCIPATDVDKDAKDYSKTGLANGDTDKKESYKIKNCKLKKDSDKVVEYTIDNADFEYEVRYLCDEETPGNPKTGIALIITAWAVGLGALGYSVYYFMNAKKEENAEL